jgi:hypothetical protein
MDLYYEFPPNPMQGMPMSPPVNGLDWPNGRDGKDFDQSLLVPINEALTRITLLLAQFDEKVCARWFEPVGVRGQDLLYENPLQVGW